jgi:hypothetical protein
MDDAPWITFTNNHNGVTLTQNKRALHNAQHVCGKNTTPSFVTVIGRRSKATILEHMIGTSLIAVQQQVYLRASPELRINETPVVFIDCDVSRGAANLPPNCDAATYVTSWEIPNVKNATATFSSRILAPFSGVIVYFVSDLGGPKGVTEWLASQAVSPPASDLPVLPRILLVMETNQDIFDENVEAGRVSAQLLDALRVLEPDHDINVQNAMKGHFHDITVIGLKS